MQAIRIPVDAAKFAASVIRRHVPDTAYRVVLFGSRSAGERSDIEIGIEVPAVSRVALAAIRDELEEVPTLYTIEVVDFAHVSEKFRRVAEHRIGAVTKAQSLRADFEKAVARLDEALLLWQGAARGRFLPKGAYCENGSSDLNQAERLRLPSITCCKAVMPMR